MKKILTAVVLSVFLISGCNKEKIEIDNNTAYMFYSQSCPHCHEAREYINKKYANVDIVKIDVGTPKGKKMMFACANKFNIKKSLGVPLFCLGDNHLMGWSDKYKIKFDAYIRPFIKK